MVGREAGPASPGEPGRVRLQGAGHHGNSLKHSGGRGAGHRRGEVRRPDLIYSLALGSLLLDSDGVEVGVWF